MFLCVKIENKNSKNVVLNLVYCPANGDHKELENYFKSSLSKQEISHKNVILGGDFNINLLDLARKEDDKEEFIYKRRFSDQSIGTFKLTLS